MIEDLYVRWQYQSTYVVEGDTAYVQIVRDPRSTYNGPFTVTWSTINKFNASPDTDYLEYTDQIAYFYEGQNSTTISIDTKQEPELLETAEWFQLKITDVQKYKTDDFIIPNDCPEIYYLSDAFPDGSLDGPIYAPVLILDKFQEHDHPTRTFPGGGGECDLKTVTATIDCSLKTLTIVGVDTTDRILKAWNSRTGELIGVVPETEAFLELPWTLDISSHIQPDGKVYVTYESCGCCVTGEYECECVINVTADIICDCGITLEADIVCIS